MDHGNLHFVWRCQVCKCFIEMVCDLLFNAERVLVRYTVEAELTRHLCGDYSLCTYELRSVCEQFPLLVGMIWTIHHICQRTSIPCRLKVRNLHFARARPSFSYLHATTYLTQMTRWSHLCMLHNQSWYHHTMHRLLGSLEQPHRVSLALVFSISPDESINDTIKRTKSVMDSWTPPLAMPECKSSSLHRCAKICQVF